MRPADGFGSASSEFCGFALSGGAAVAASSAGASAGASVAAGASTATVFIIVSKADSGFGAWLQDVRINGNIRNRKTTNRAFIISSDLKIEQTATAFAVFLLARVRWSSTGTIRYFYYRTIRRTIQ
jgi:hypothetical protein